MDGAALMKIAMIQMEVDSGQKDRNIRHAFQLLEQAVPNSDVLVLPELWTIGYDFHNLDKNATRLGDSLISGLSSFANYHHVTLEAGTLPVEVNGKISNMGIVFGPNGEIQAQYSKRHLFYGYEESKLMVPGNSLMNTEINGVKTGMAVCYEFYFPRMWRKNGKERSDISAGSGFMACRPYSSMGSPYKSQGYRERDLRLRGQYGRRVPRAQAWRAFSLY